MTVKGSPPSSPTKLNKARFVHQLFDAISPRYDLFNRISSFGMDRHWRRRTIESLQLEPGMQVLDLASGTGDLASLAAADLLPLGKVTACDLSGPMLQLSRRNLQRHPTVSWHLQWVQGQAEALPFPDQSFHAATIGFALRNVADLEGTFRELHRVLKPGGRLGLLEFGRPRSWWLAAGHRVWLSTGVPAIGILTTGKIWPFLYLRRSILQFMEPEEVMIALEQAGFIHPRVEPFTGGAVLLYNAVSP